MQLSARNQIPARVTGINSGEAMPTWNWTPAVSA
jgi:hypothetical protein